MDQYSKGGGTCVDELTLLKHVPSLISEENNELLKAFPTKDEVKKVVFEINGDCRWS